MDGIRATPMQYPILGLLADRLKKAQQFAVAPGGYANPPAEILLNLLGVPAIQQTMERVAYGEPLTTGRGMTTQIRPEVAEAAMTLLPAAAGTARVAERGAMVAGRAGERMAERVVPQIMERGGMPAGLLEGMSSRTVSPLTVYHGSPAKFERFDPTKIGSGEGAQAYGYGHYVAESPNVAREYQKNLANPIKNQTDTAFITARTAFVKGDGDVKKAMNYLDQQQKITEDASGFLVDKGQKALSDIEQARVLLKSGAMQSGNLYEIDLPDEQIARMLDWDKPLSKQPENVQAALEKLGYKVDRADVDKYSDALLDALMTDAQTNLPKQPLDMAGEALYRKLGNPEQAAQRLREAGIPGIRYLDQGSRGAGEGTSNFVVFPGNEDLLTILKRNGGLLGQYPQEQALQLAQKNAAKPISEGGLGLPKDNTPMDRAKAMGFDTPIYHATSADFEEFVPSSLRGASYFASSPERAMRGAKAGAADRLGAGQPDRVMPLVTRSQEVEGLTISKPQREWFNSLPEEATESQVQSLMNKAPKDGYWFMWYDEIKLPSGEFKYVKKQEPFVSYEQAVKTNKDIYGRGFSDYSDASSERFASEMAKNQGRGAYLQNDESGLAMAVVDPSIVRSRFAAFDPARRNEADILAGVLPLSLLADEEQRKKADVYFRSLLGQ